MDKKTIVVTGDVVSEHHLYAGDRVSPDEDGRPGTVVREQLGGAAFLHALLDAAFRAGASGPAGQWQVQFGLDTNSLQSLPSRLRTYALWRPAAPARPGSGKQTVWRLATPLGFGSPTPEHRAEQPGERARGLTATPDIIVIDDQALGFRFWPAHGRWPFEDPKTAPPLVVLKMSAPLAQGDLWHLLSKASPDRLVLLVSANDLRRERIRISKGVSWERTAEDAVDELRDNPAARDLLECRHLVIALDDGALWIDRSAAGTGRARLIFDPEHGEGEWGREMAGNVPDALSCLAAAIVHELASAGSLSDAGIVRGLAAMRRLRESGHVAAAGQDPQCPLADVAAAITNAAGGFSAVTVPGADQRQRAGRDWMMTADGGGRSQPLFGAATRIARFGLKAVDNIPIGRFGKLVTVDRREIEALRNIRRLIEDYESAPSSGKPLSLAVFGPPGAGKSFGIKQIAEGVLGKGAPVLEFNLSQFTGAHDLVGAWHEVRDRALQGRTPVVFWDEFDAREYEWLQYFLAPMQDGKFQEGQITHTVGKSIFVFAGATSHDADAFGPRPGDRDGEKPFRLRKGPDFLSRLHGTLSVLGPNPRLLQSSSGEMLDDPEDVCFPVRRALLLRALFGLGPDEPLDVDPGLLAALLEIDHYRYGARSMEMIAQHLKRRGGWRLRRSHLPDAETMRMHVSYPRFTELCDHARDFQSRAALLAPAIHETFRRLSRQRGWKLEYDVDFQALPEDVKSDNVAAAHRIPEILDLVGLTIAPGGDRADGAPATIPAILESNMEALAREEHNGWMAHKIRNGWRRGPERSRDLRTHPALVDYDGLGESDREKDRDAVRHFPDMVTLAGFTIVPNQGSAVRGSH